MGGRRSVLLLLVGGRYRGGRKDWTKVTEVPGMKL